MPHIKISKLNSQDNYKEIIVFEEIIVFDGEITEEQNKKVNDFFHTLYKSKEIMMNNLIEKMKNK